MSQLPANETESTLAWPGLLAAIPGASDREEIDRLASMALAWIAPGRQSEVVWADSPLAAQIDPALRARLEAGDSVPIRADHPGYVPINCGDSLVGWISFGPDRWNTIEKQALQLLAALVGSAFHTLPDPRRNAIFALDDAIDTIHDTLQIDIIFEQIDRIAQQTFGPICIMVVLRYRNSSWLELAYYSYNGEHVPQRFYWEHRSGLTGAILQLGESIITDDYAAECARRGFAPIILGIGPDARAWMGAPLCDGEHTFGVFSIFTGDETLRFTPLQQELFLHLTGRIARTVHNARIFAETEQQARQVQTLNKITRSINSTLDPQRVPALIIEQAQDLLHAEEGSLLLLDEQTGELVFSYAGGPAGNQLLGQRLPSGAGVAGYVASSGQPAIVNNARADGRFYSALDSDTGFTTRSLLAVPLRGIDGIKGVIEILNRRDNAPFSEEDRTLLEAIADQAMIALDNARHFAQVDQALTRRAQELDRSNDRLRNILRVSNALRAEHRLDSLLQKIVHSVSESVGFRSAVIALVQRERTAGPYLQRKVAAGPVAASMQHIGQARAPLSKLEELLRPEFRRGNSTYLIDRRYDDFANLWGGKDHVYEPPAQPARPGGWDPGDTLFSLLRDSHGELLGLLCVDDPEDGMLPGYDQVQILEILANQAASVIENARLYSELQHSLNSMTALNGLGMALNTTLRSPLQIYELTAAGMVELSDARWAEVLLTDKQTDSLHAIVRTGHFSSDLSTGTDLAKEAIAARRPISMAANPATGQEAQVAIPLRATRSILGAICIGYAEGLPRVADLESLSLFANQAAVAVESLHLFNAVRTGRDQLASIMDSTREGMLLIDEQSRVAVANGAFLILSAAGEWSDGSGGPGADLSDMDLSTLLERWQAVANYPALDLEQLKSGMTLVAEGSERYVHGQLNATRPGERFLEWIVLRAVNEGDESGYSGSLRHWPILLTLRDITAAKETERIRQDLTNMMIHDLRSPLASIMSSIDMFFRGTAGDISKVQREILSIAYTSAQSLLNMVNLLLDISRLESRQMPLDRTHTEVEPLIRRTLTWMGPIAQKQEIDFDLEIAAGAQVMYVDGELVMRVLQNLLDNALKFSPGGSRVILRAAPDDDGQTICFCVRDFGPGIMAHDIEKIFTKFGQAGNRRKSGSGLGLTFCKLVIEAHGGRIWVESSPGEGSSFLFTLPIEA